MLEPAGRKLLHAYIQSHDVILAGRDPGALPRKVLTRDVYDYLYGLGLMDLNPNRGLGRLIGSTPGAGEIGVGDSADAMAMRTGIRRVGRVADYESGAFVTEEGGSIVGVEAVVFATGYRNRYPWLGIEDALDEDGLPRQRQGISPIANLYWVGLPMMRRFGSSLLGGVGKDAAYIAKAIYERKERCLAAASSPARNTA